MVVREGPSRERPREGKFDATEEREEGTAGQRERRRRASSRWTETEQRTLKFEIRTLPKESL